MSIHAATRLTGGRSSEVPWDQLAGVRVGVVLWGGLALVDAGRLAAVPAYAELGALALLVGAASVGMRTTTALAAALVGWLVFNGFVAHRLGVLGFDGTPDLARLCLLAGLALTATRARR